MSIARGDFPEGKSRDREHPWQYSNSDCEVMVRKLGMEGSLGGKCTLQRPIIPRLVLLWVTLYMYSGKLGR